MRRHRIFLTVTTALVLVLAGLLVGGRVKTARYEAELLPLNRKVVGALELTDLAVWTEARYTRHPSQADFFSAFQDSPGSLEHFPAGSVVAPPDSGFRTDSQGPR